MENIIIDCFSHLEAPNILTFDLSLFYKKINNLKTSLK